MAHGSKRWIVRYDGRVKKSNDRTKKDYYGDLKWWDEYHHRYGNYSAKPKSNCPQCRHVEKDVLRLEEENRFEKQELMEQYEHIYGEANKLWNDFHHKSGRWWDEVKNTTLCRPPTVTRPPYWYEWVKTMEQVRPIFWTFDARNFLCWKHERKYEMKEEMWYMHMHGEKSRYQYMARQENVYYRNEVKNLMQKAKYDESYYEDIPPKKVNGYLD